MITIPWSDGNIADDARSASVAQGAPAMTEEPYSHALVEESMGGHAEIENYRQRSMRLKEEIERRCGEKNP